MKSTYCPRTGTECHSGIVYLNEKELNCPKWLPNEKVCIDTLIDRAELSHLGNTKHLIDNLPPYLKI